MWGPCVRGHGGSRLLMGSRPSARASRPADLYGGYASSPPSLLRRALPSARRRFLTGHATPDRQGRRSSLPARWGLALGGRLPVHIDDPELELPVPPGSASRPAPPRGRPGRDAGMGGWRGGAWMSSAERISRLDRPRLALGTRCAGVGPSAGRRLRGRCVACQICQIAESER